MAADPVKGREVVLARGHGVRRLGGAALRQAEVADALVTSVAWPDSILPATSEGRARDALLRATTRAETAGIRSSTILRRGSRLSDMLLAESTALEYYDRLRNAGYPAEIEPTREGLYHVRIRQLASREDAEAQVVESSPERQWWLRALAVFQADYGAAGPLVVAGGVEGGVVRLGQRAEQLGDRRRWSSPRSFEGVLCLGVGQQGAHTHQRHAEENQAETGHRQWDRPQHGAVDGRSAQADTFALMQGAPPVHRHMD